MNIFVENFLSKELSKERTTSAFHFFDPEIPGIGRVYGLVTISGTGDFDPVNVSRFVWNGVQESFRGSEREENVTELKDALQAAKSKLAELIKHDDNLEEGVGLEIGLIRYIGNVIYFGFIGETQIFIYHEDSIINISELLGDNGVNAGSTELTLGDIAGLYIVNKEPASLKAKTSIGLIEELEKRSISNEMDSLLTSISVDLTEIRTASQKEVVVGSGVEILDLSRSNDPQESNDIDQNEVPGSDGTDEVDIEQDLLEEVPEQEQKDENKEEKKLEIEMADEDIELTGINDDLEEPQEGSPAAPRVDEGFAETTVSSREGGKEAGQDIPNITDDGPNSDLVVEDLATDPYDENDKKNDGEQDGNKIINGLSSIIGKVADSIGAAFKNTKAWANRFLLNKYGRKAWFKRFRARFSQSRFSSHRTPNITVGDYKEKTKRNKRLTVAFIILIVFGSGYFGVRSAKTLRDERMRNTEFLSFYNEATELLETARTNISVDQESAKIALTKANDLISDKDYTEEYLSEENWNMFTELQGDVMGISDDLTSTVRLTEDEGNISEFVDFNIISGNGSKPTDIAIYSDSFSAEVLVITDKGRAKVYSIPLVDPNLYEPIPDPDNLLKEPLFVDIGNSGIFVYDAVSGFLKAPFADESKTETKPFVSLSGVSRDDLGDIDVDEMAILTGDDNIYILDSSDRSVFKSSNSGGGSYGLPYRFFDMGSEEQTPTDFFAGISLYVTSSSGVGVQRFVSSTDGIGGPTEFPVGFARVQGSLTGISAGYTGGNLNHPLVVFNSQARTFMIFEKPDEVNGRHPNEMLLISQYAYRGEKNAVFGDVQDLVVNQSDRKIYVVDGLKVWEIDIAK